MFKLRSTKQRGIHILPSVSLETKAGVEVHDQNNPTYSATVWLEDHHGREYFEIRRDQDSTSADMAIICEQLQAVVSCTDTAGSMFVLAQLVDELMKFMHFKHYGVERFNKVLDDNYVSEMIGSRIEPLAEVVAA